MPEIYIYIIHTHTHSIYHIIYIKREREREKYIEREREIYRGESKGKAFNYLRHIFKFQSHMREKQKSKR